MFFFKKKKHELNYELDLNNIPKHMAFIMDGNGRWAKQRKYPVSMGHSKGADRVEDTIRFGKKIGVECMSFYAFSTENWKRDDEEIAHIFGLIHKFYKTKFQTLNKEGIKLKFIGTRQRIPADLLEVINKMETISADNTEMTVNIAFNYGGRLEITETVNKLIAEGKTELTEADINDNLYTAGQGDVDLMIRTSGEQRLSNFLLWQLAYAEFVFTDTYWPDFDEHEFENCLLTYQNRNRRFGGR